MDNDRGRSIALSVTIIAFAAVMVLTLWSPATESSAKTGPSNHQNAKGAQGPELDDAGFVSNGPASVSVSPESADPDPASPLLLTVPRLAHLRDSEIPTAGGDDEEALKNHAGVHLAGTGYPWQEGANVYIAGHRMGYPGTPSDRAFYDLDSLRKGDEIILADANGRSYLYRVYETLEVGPNEVEVTLPVPGKSIVSLQTCTLPDYSRRIVVRAEMVEG